MITPLGKVEKTIIEPTTRSSRTPRPEAEDMEPSLKKPKVTKIMVVEKKLYITDQP